MFFFQLVLLQLYDVSFHPSPPFCIYVIIYNPAKSFVNDFSVVNEVQNISQILDFFFVVVSKFKDK